MSFGTYARRTRDGDLPYWVRYCVLRCASAVGKLGYPSGYHLAFRYFLGLGRLARLVINDPGAA